MTVRARVVFGAILFLVGCATTPPSPSPAGTAGTAGPTATAGAPGDPTPGPGESPVPDAGESPQGRIADALAAGRIDYGTSLLYRAYALFGDAALPAEYQADVPQEDSGLLDEVELAGNSLPAEIRDKLTPYVVRPDDPRSIHSQPVASAMTHSALAALPGVAQVPGQEAVLCGTNGWATLTSEKGFKVWSLCTGDYPDVVRFTYDVLDGIWDDETQLMGRPIADLGGAKAGGDGSIDFYLVDHWQCVRRDGRCRDTTIVEEDGSLSYAAGIAPGADPKAGPAGARTASGYVVLDRDAVSDSDFANTIAHELFHVVQNAYNWEGKYGKPQGSMTHYHWLVESSAEWAGWYFAPGDRMGAAANFRKFIGEPTVSLNKPADADDRRYRAWVWHLFREIESGGGKFMTATWNAVRGKTTYQAFDVALDAVYSFREHFRDFAVKNVNRALEPGDPLKKRYRAVHDALDAEIRMTTDKPLSGSPAGDFPTTWSVNIPTLTANYSRIRFDDDVRRIRLDLSGLENDDLDADALIRLPSGWERRELTFGETRFCRDVATEDVSEMYLVLTNHAYLSSSVPVSGEVELEALAAGCAGGRGTVTITREKHGTYTSNRNNPVKVDVTDTATITFELEADEFSEGIYNATHASITWSYSLNAVESADGCEIVEVGRGQGTWAGDSGPTVMLGWSSPDGTLFGMTLDEAQYVLQAIPPPADMPDADPRGYYEVSSRLCTMPVIPPGTWWPYTSVAFVSGALPEGGSGTFSGSRQRTVPDLISPDVPTTETVTWSFTLGETATP